MNPIDPVEKLLTMSDKPVVSDLVTARYLEAQNAPPMPDTRLQYKTYDDDVKSSDELYDPMDFKKVGGLIRDNVVHSIQTRFPVVGDKYTLTVENVTYEKPKNTSLKDEKYALQHGQSVSDRLRGDWVLYDNTTGQEIQRKSATLLNVPRMTERGTFIRNGAEQGLKHMFRLRPGIYARIKGDGHPSVHINPAQLTGRQMSLDMDPETGIMIAKRGTRTYGVLPLLLASGVPEEAIRASWGDELYDMNYAKYGKMINPENKVFQEYQALYKDELEPIQLDEETTESTMGVPHKSLTPDALLQASNKVLKLSRSMSADDEDDRDSLAYQRVMGPADYIPERIVRDGGGLVRKMFQRVIRDGHLDSIESGAFQPHVDSVFLEDKHASYIDGASPFEAMDLNSMVSRIGEGGIGDIKAAPAETRGVNDSYLGFIDPIRSPECYSEDTEILTKDGWVSVKDMTMDMEYACLIDDLLMYKKADAINVYDFDGEMIGYDSTAISFCVTPNHRMYTVSLLDEEDAYHIVLACNMYEERDLQFFASGRHFHNTQIHLAPQNFSKIQYTGKVYCPTVPGGLVYVRRNEKAGFWCGNSLKVGLDVYMAYGTKKDSKGRLYANFLDKAGNSGYRPMDTIARSIVATPEFYDPMADPNEFIPAINKGKQIDYVRRKDVDFFLASSNNMMSIGAGTIPNIGGIRSNRTLMGCLHPATELIVKIGASVSMHITAAEALKLYNDGVAVKIPVMTEDKTSYYWKEVRQVLKMFSRPIFDIATEDGNVARVTDNHKWLVKDVDGNFDLVESSKLSLANHLIPKATINGEIKWVGMLGIGVSLMSDTDYTVDIDVDDNVYMLANGLFTHNSKYPLQALSLEKREAPLVQRKMTVDGTDTTTERVIAKQLGAKFAPADGKVISVSADEIVIKDREGQKHTIELYNNYPANQKGFITNTPLVQEGQRVHANDVLAKSNYTTDTGEAALGVNLRTAFLPAKNSANFEDAIVISESAAKKLASEQMHKFRGDLSSDTEYGKKKFLQLFGAGEYTKEQLDKIGDDGMPAPGTVFQKGDPVFLGTQIRDLSTAGLSRRASVPYVKLWEHEEPGTVIDVTQGKKHMTIYTKSYTPMRPGDKMCFDDQTEILTDSGWKFFKDLLLDDKVLTIDYHTGESRFVDYSDAYSYDVVDEKMYTLKTKRLDICTTKEHRHLVSCMNNSSYLTLKTSDEIFGKRIYHLVGLDLDSRYNFAGSKDDNPKEKWTKYTGKVYCVTVPGTHTMYIRRNGKAVWSGNSGKFGAKGTVSEIRPDSQMPQDPQGRPMEVLMTPLGLPSRLNTAMLGELQLSKIAEARGQAYTIPDFIIDDTIDGFVSKELKKYGLQEKEDLYDPVAGKTIPQVSTGLLYNYKLKQTAEYGERGRGTGVYTSEDVPMKGEGAARRFGMMEASAVYAGGGMDVLRDAKLIRGQRNDDFWHDYKEGLTPQMPTTPLVHKKFLAYLRASGANIQRNGDLVHMYAATDNDMKDLTGNRKVTSASTFDSKNMHPIDGGLFDPKIFGADGDQWGYVDLPEPVLNPLMFKPIASIMGWTDTELKEYLQGSRHTKGDFGTIPLMEQLKSVDLKSELKKAKDVLKAEGRTTIAQRDLARKRIRAIEPMLREGKHPTDFFFTRMPILPPKYRTVTTIGDETNVAADANFLYKRMMDAADDLKAAKDNLPEEYQVDARESLYNAVNAVVGTMPTDDPKLEAKGVGGLLKWAFGKGSPKHSSAHRKIFGANLDMGGLGVITPDGDLSIDEVGIPEESAWKMFEPFVLRDLRQSGFSSLNAMREVMERTPEARRSLERQMANRPILVNRAPTLWRYGIQGMYPRIVKDKSIHLNPNVCKTYAADFDGDKMSTHVPVSNEAVRAIKENMLPSKNLISPQTGKAHFIPRDGANTGLYLASRIGKGTPVKFRTEEEAEEAYRKGLIKIDTPIEIV